MENNTNPTAEAIKHEMRSISFRIQSLLMAVDQDVANIVASANSLKRDVEAGFVRKDNGGFVQSHLNSYIRNSGEVENLTQQLRVLEHIHSSTTGAQ